jgi:DNA-binding response OmpR family regulator
MATRVLIAEDDPNVRNSLHKFLSREGYEVTCAQDGQEALEALPQIHPEVLVTDVMMPHLNGYQLVNAVMNERGDIPVPKIIILTSRIHQADAKRSLALGADAYIPKPFHMRELLQVMQDLLRERVENVTEER